MIMNSEQWGQLISRSLERDPLARTEAALTIASSKAQIELLRPPRFVHPEGWDCEDGERKHKFVEDLRNARDIASVRERALGWPIAFGEWRRAVYDHEATCAAKLQVLLWVVQTLHTLGDEGDELKYKVMEFLDREWKLSVVPVDGSYRDWCVKQTRKPHLLPNAWRYV
jgi:hypothetical protein